VRVSILVNFGLRSVPSPVAISWPVTGRRGPVLP
jgi:hypothetical protein